MGYTAWDSRSLHETRGNWKMTAKKTIFSGTKLLRPMIWIHFIYGKCRSGWLVLPLTLSRDVFCIKEEIISSNLLNGTSYYCFMPTQGIRTGVTPRVISPKQRTVLSLSKSQWWLSIAYKVQTPFLASTLLHGLSPWGNPSRPLLPCIFAQPPCGGSLWRGHFGLADSSVRGAEVSLKKVSCPQDVGERGQKARIEADPWKGLQSREQASHQPRDEVDSEGGRNEHRLARWG